MKKFLSTPTRIIVGCSKGIVGFVKTTTISVVTSIIKGCVNIGTSAIFDITGRLSMPKL
ncbi:MAG: hypothetical protein RR420_01395 [Anaerovoracaceae bacterium]